MVYIIFSWKNIFQILYSESNSAVDQRGYYGILPVSNLDSSSFKTSPDEEVPNLFVVYLRTKSGPQGPKPLHYTKFNIRAGLCEAM